MKNLAFRFKVWRKWCKSNRNSTIYKLAVLFHFAKSPTFRNLYFWESYKDTLYKAFNEGLTKVNERLL